MSDSCGTLQRVAWVGDGYWTCEPNRRLLLVSESYFDPDGDKLHGQNPRQYLINAVVNDRWRYRSVSLLSPRLSSHFRGPRRGTVPDVPGSRLSRDRNKVIDHSRRQRQLGLTAHWRVCGKRSLSRRLIAPARTRGSGVKRRQQCGHFRCIFFSIFRIHRMQSIQRSVADYSECGRFFVGFGRLALWRLWRVCGGFGTACGDGGFGGFMAGLLAST